MRCERCHGLGRVPFWHEAFDMDVDRPCPECGGTGITSCCEGHEGQPEKDSDEVATDKDGAD